jgi:hypothetical protein
MISDVPTPDPDTQTPVQRFRVPLSAWEAFGRTCRRQGIPRARRLFDLMWSDVRRHGTDEDRAAFVAADRELRARRSRKHSPAA